ncbi:MAG: hypothetical protein QOJ29_357 [Thermoleophilaceae bacterium]|nr:hypothetical protein [Thermoleophilaceae bacterium]
MTLALRRGSVVAVDSEGPPARIRVNCGEEERPAISYEAVAVGDDVVVNVAAVELGLGSGGFDIVHVNLTRGLDQPSPEGAHVMKLNYTSLQHAVEPVESHEFHVDRDIRGERETRGPVAVIALHAQLPCVAWQANQRLPDARIGYIQTWGGALPGSLSRVVQTLRSKGLLAGHITAGASHGGEQEAISIEGAIEAALRGWEAAIIGPGPGIIGSDTALGHGGLAALESAHAALALGCIPLIVPRMSSGDPRPRHQGLSHHTETVLNLLLKPVHVALPEAQPIPGGHQGVSAVVDLDGYRESGLPATTMGREIDQDELFFRAALAGGAVLAEEIDVVRAGGN